MMGLNKYYFYIKKKKNVWKAGEFILGAGQFRFSIHLSPPFLIAVEKRPAAFESV